MAAKKRETGKGLYKKRYATLKEHRAAVAARKATKGVGPVKSGAEYGRSLTKGKSASLPKTAQATKTPTVKQSTKAEAAKRFYSSSSQGSIQKNLDQAKSNFFRSSSATRGENVKSNPALKSQPKKPSRSSFPAGRAGASKYLSLIHISEPTRPY